MTSVQGLVILAFGRRAAARLAAIAQAGAVLLFLMTLLFLDPVRAFVMDAIRRGDPADRCSSGSARVVPRRSTSSSPARRAR